MLSIKPYLRSLKLNPDMAIDYDAYPFCIPAVRELEQIQFHPEVTFLALLQKTLNTIRPHAIS
ncbi:hypothetical protein BCF11_1608 [Collimonas sp. PA-H2]|uniref:hypothetical protein n=1 Tax=Collimonas sp. PA-H2 TaxID=1881062 RepID=UPI000BF64965|nr:hypothetical protein [Collimonas sp. PA-H2]PFH09218.1 hypothetical protein BCF11_1608 [Collimonas sp. PA-H2]